ncbi:cytochrome P450 [Sphingobium amiense]|nr:cytochrome P450 [Sphingobium amiense]
MRTSILPTAAADGDMLSLVHRLGDPAFFLAPQFHPLLRELRRSAPVAWTQAWEDRGFWSVTRYHDIREVLNQPQLFSSQEYGSQMPTDPHMYDTAEARQAGGVGLIPTFTDGQIHDDIRKAVYKPFGPAQVAKLTELCQQVCDELIDGVIDRGECEFVGDVAARVPMYIICMMLGLPRADWDMLHSSVNSAINNEDPDVQLGDTPLETFRIAQKFQIDYLRDAIRARRASPTDDLIARSALAKIGDDLVPEENILWWCWSFLLGGFETSRNVISEGLLALINHPAQAERLRLAPEGEREAAEEMVRWTTPSPQMLRVATADTVIAGQPIKKGDWLIAWLASANRDETVFENPYMLDLERKPNPHLSFGYGTHNCIGRYIALLEIRRIIMTALQRLKNMEVAGEIDRVASCFGMGIKRMPIRFQAR